MIEKSRLLMRSRFFMYKEKGNKIGFGGKTARKRQVNGGKRNEFHGFDTDPFAWHYSMKSDRKTSRLLKWDGKKCQNNV